MSSEASTSKVLRSGKKLMTVDVKRTEENLEPTDNISKRENSKKSTIRSSLRKQKIQAKIEAQEKLDKIEEEKEKIEMQRLERMQRKIMLELELKNAISDESDYSEEKSNIIFDEVDSQFKHNQVQTWINNVSCENFENHEKGQKDKQTIDVREKSNRFEEQSSTRQITPKTEEKQEKLMKSTEKQFLEKIITRQSLNKDLPYFSGNPIEWQNFITQFEETTELCQFSDRENMSRLQKCLKGKAKETVHTLLNFPNKLKDVLQLLERRFGRKEDIIEQIFTQLKHTKQVREENLENTVELSNTLQNMTVCLESLNCEEYLINPQIMRELIDKLPLNLKMNWAIHVKSQEKKVISIKDFSLWLEEFTQTIGYMQLSIDEESRSKIQWDEKLSGNSMKKWYDWLQLLKNLSQLEIPRCYFAFKCTYTDLHIFCDSSEKAYAAVAYFRTENNGKTEISFIASKVRVAPLKTISIPRLELLAAVLGARLGNFILRNHVIHVRRTIYWSDSKTVILWLRADFRNYKQFVTLRVEEILDKTNNGMWRWVNTKQNIADEATKWNKPEDVQNWLGGPSFLKKPEEQWPKENFGNEVCSLEKRKFVALVTEKSSFLPDLKRFSKWTKLVRTTAWILRFINNIKISSKRKQERKMFSGLLPEEIDIAEKKWIKSAQKEDFESEIEDLRNLKKVTKESRLYQLTPYLDKENIIRMSGRLKHAPNLDDNYKNPIILDPKNELTRLLIHFYHEKNFHQGQETVVNMLREKYWILRMRNAVKKCISDCLFCRNRKSKLETPQMGYLPTPRVTGYERPFTNCGIDYFGPMMVKIGRRCEKRYGVLFTCLAIRAIHIEMAHSLETDSAILAIKRMISRRGCPKKMYSDNGTNLRGADKEIRTFLDSLDQKVILDELTMRGITWYFSPATGAHFGGSWERLIRSVKVSLKVILKETVPKEETLQTVLTEIEHSVNSRPLTWISENPEDAECITPNHFLIGSSSGSPVLGGEVQIDLKKQWTIAQNLADNFWKRWLREYLPTINKRSKWFKDPENLKVNDLVVIADSNNPRNYWPKGRIIRVHPGQDGRVRVVDVQTATGIYRRPVSKLCRLC